ncbi:GGDEF domain-containing protein [Aquipuribacter sp. MA13-6]|uniref:GGDEF domain-containing protein n=1 Tax=Aquipuribacter sp. MA13-6 TaxID=3440839 RepID=UPI003EF027AD
MDEHRTPADLGPHDLATARRTVAALSVVSAAVLLGFTVLVPESSSLPEVSFTVVLLMTGLAAGVLLAPARVAAALCLLIPLVGVAGITALDLLTRDTSLAAVVFFFLPVLFGASQLRRAGAVTVLGAAVLGHGTVVGSLLPPGEAVADFVYLGVVLVTTTVLLVRAGERQRALVVRLQRQAAIDPLTGLVTRRVLDDALGVALSSAAATEGTSLIIVDVDRFKDVNDTYGHPVGDDALELLGRLLREVSRPGDVVATEGTSRIIVDVDRVKDVNDAYGHPVGDDALELLGRLLREVSRPGDVVARMGGDELALLLPACPYDRAVARAVAVVERVRSRPVDTVEGTQVHLTVSAGVAHAPDHATDVRALYAAADHALYRAKRAGRDQVGLQPALSEAS